MARRPRPARRHFAPVVGLFFLAPLIGEFLLGNLPITWLWVLPMLALLYGSGALLIRETARRFGLGWPGMIPLGLAYAVIEEAFVTRSLFNPDYLGLRLLDYGYVPTLGIGAWWTVFVLSIHTIWSTAVPIALVESLTPGARRDPWLGRGGLVIAAILFVAGCLLLFTFQQQDSSIATASQLLVSGAVVLALMALAVLLGRRLEAREGADGQAPPPPRLVGATAFLLGSAFMSLAIVHNGMPAALNVGGMLAALAVGCFALWRWSQRGGWRERHRLAAAGGLLLTYAWYGFVQVPSTGNTGPWLDALGNALFASGALALLALAGKRVPGALAPIPGDCHVITGQRTETFDE